MKIVKYQKLKNSKYKIVLEDKESVDVYEDVILNNDLLLKKEIEDLDKVINDNKKYALYDLCIKYLSLKLRSIKELKEYLLKKEYPLKDIKEVIDKLIKDGYLNDKYYAKCYISDRLNLSLDGPLKIIKYLESNDIDESLYQEYILIFDEELENQRINKYLDKQSKVNKKSLFIFKKKMLYNLINLGYHSFNINECLHKFTFDDKENYEKEKEKIYHKLQGQYSGNELDKMVQEKLHQKGFFL